MKKVCFFNFFHNGDLFHSKPFVKQVVEHLGRENVAYAHTKDHTCIKDLIIQHARLQGMPQNMKIHVSDETNVVFVNTWIGSYFDVYEGECTLNFNMKMWNDIYKSINEVLSTNLVLKSVENYLPYIDYNEFDLTKVDDYLKKDNNKKILFSNGPALSGQCDYNSDLSEIIVPLAYAYPNITFLTTQPLQWNAPNIVYTGNIIQSNFCDLNEIAYLSKYCDLIIGKNSGPFCFASTGENLNDPSKTFYAFGTRETDCFTHNIPKKSNYIFEKFVSPEQLNDSITTLVSKV